VKMFDRRTGLEMLDRDTCLELLAAEQVGRLAIGGSGAPVLMPVNYALDGETVVFRTDPGTKLERAGRWGRAAFEIDSFDREARTGWSVVVTGRLEEVTRHDAATLQRVTRLPLFPWAPGEKHHWLRLVPTQITGRRVGGPAR
jgi:nitroimidazol reductase NimA-like FMN-containing flavoprotein (pyridoxamine 5'-phosphate oxidase superfamily)